MERQATVARSPPGRSPRAQDIEPHSSVLQTPCEGEAEISPTVPGRVSSTVTSGAAFGPWLWTVTV